MSLKHILSLALTMILTTPMAFAANEIRTDAPIKQSLGEWVDWTPVYGNWVNIGTPSNCTNWSPDTNTVTAGTSFMQTATDCQQMQQRSVQATERNDVSNVIRNEGVPTTATQYVQGSATQTSVGTKKAAEATVEYVVTVGSYSGQWGYLPNVLQGSLVSSSNSSYVLNYASLGFQNDVLVNLKGAVAGDASKYASIKIQMLDSTGAVFYTMSSDNITDIYHDTLYYMGWVHTATDLANAKLANRFIIDLYAK